jgi:hypothetical protein
MKAPSPERVKGAFRALSARWGLRTLRRILRWAEPVLHSEDTRIRSPPRAFVVDGPHYRRSELHGDVRCRPVERDRSAAPFARLGPVSTADPRRPCRRSFRRARRGQSRNGHRRALAAFWDRIGLGYRGGPAGPGDGRTPVLLAHVRSLGHASLSQRGQLGRSDSGHACRSHAPEIPAAQEGLGRLRCVQGLHLQSDDQVGDRVDEQTSPTASAGFYLDQFLLLPEPANRVNPTAGPSLGSGPSRVQGSAR